MTAELVIMNGRAVAMAADSAVTISNGGGSPQTHFSANKLFNLSYDHPVGIMVYNGASIHSVPWETVIKVYRNQLGDKKFDYLKEYAESFIDFLSNNRDVLFSNLPDTDFSSAVEGLLVDLHLDITGKWQESNNNKHPKEPIKKFVNQIIVDISEEIGDLKFADLSKKKIKKLLDRVSSEISGSNFALVRKLYAKNEEALAKVILYSMFDRSCFGHTGVVFSGFGEKDIFPSSCSFDVYGFYLETLRVEGVSCSSIKNGADVIVKPYAQTHMIDTFMKGISPKHEVQVKKTFLDLLVSATVDTISEISDLGDAQKIKWIERLGDRVPEVYTNMSQWLSGYLHENHTRSIIEGIKFLTKDELASVAESMLSLSTLHKKVSNGDDSVGGAIDLAVISKGDGFIWINRKHYFKPDLNPHFFTRFS